MEHDDSDIIHRAYRGWGYRTINHDKLMTWSQNIEEELFTVFDLNYAKAIFYTLKEDDDTTLTIKLDNLSLIIHAVVSGK